MERLWSYLRRFGRMTKEMRPSHRIDILSSALEYYGRKKKNKLGISNSSHSGINLIICFLWCSIIDFGKMG